MISDTKRLGLVGAAVAGLALAVLPSLASSKSTGGGQIQVPTTLDDFIQPGSQPLDLVDPVVSNGACSFCHAEYLEDDVEPWDGWVNSVMAQSARDPVWYAALDIANQDANMSGEYCIRCHSPGAWLAGRSVPPDASGFMGDFQINDFDGVTCTVCHRMVNPILEADSPPEDVPILAGLTLPPGDGLGNGRFILDPNLVRRGPLDDVPQNVHGVPIVFSPFHRRSEICATCHDLANPVFMRQPDGSYAVTDPANNHGIGMPHGTQDPYDMFPEQRTYSEWLNSDYANGGVYYADGRFGGDHPTGVMEDCQDCHMPIAGESGACAFWQNEPFFARDVPQHTFAGANTWILDAILANDIDGNSNLTPEGVADAKARNMQMLRDASDMEVVQRGDHIKVRVVNQSGHKLPTGYPEGRRMWLNVKYYDDQDALIDERGHYDFATAELDDQDTKVYKIALGISPELASIVNLPAGESQRLVVVDQILLDNRIPPRGFTNAAYDVFGGAPVAHVYEDGQYWDDTEFTIPANAVRASVTLYYQPMTKEYIEFLRDANQGPKGHRGDVAYNLWADPLVGNKVAPVDMDSVDIDLTEPLEGDVDGNGFVNFQDLLEVLSNWGPCPPPSICAADLDCSGDIGFQDLLLVLSNWTG